MDLFGGISQQKNAPVRDISGAVIHEGQLVKYIGSLAAQYATNGAAIGVVDSIEGGQLCLRLVKDSKTHRLKVAPREVRLN